MKASENKKKKKEEEDDDEDEEQKIRIDPKFRFWITGQPMQAWPT